MKFQNVNTKALNSVRATCVFSCFEASDSITNLHIPLDRFKEEIADINGMSWR